MREMASVCKDGNGFIWSSSKTGVLRVTESDYRIYSLPYKTANILTVRLTYNDSFLIAYANNGQLFRYNELYDRFDLLSDLRVTLDNTFLSIGKIVIDNQQTLWIPTSAGLCRYKDEKIEKIDKEENQMQSIAFYDETHLFIATRNYIDLLDINTLERKCLHKINGTLQINNIFYDENMNILWIGTSTNGLFYYDIKKNQLLPFPINNFPKQPIEVIEQGSDSTLLIGIDGQGVWELDKHKKSVLNIFKEDVDNPLSLRGDGVYDIFCDGDKRVWVTTYTGGLPFLIVNLL